MRHLAKKMKFGGKALELQGMSLMETNLAMPGKKKEDLAMQVAASKPTALGLGLLPDPDGDRSDEDSDSSDWQPRLRRTALAGNVQEGKVVTPF